MTTTADFTYTPAQLAEIAQITLALAKKQGASSAECDLSEGIGHDISVRRGDVESIEYNQDKGLTLTVYVGQKKGHASTADLSPKGLQSSVEAALNIARYTATDAHAGLSEAMQMAQHFPDLSLCHPWDISIENSIALASEAEAAALAVSDKLTNTEGGSLSTSISQFIYANSHGFCHGWQSSSHSISASVIASLGEEMQRDYWYSSARDAQDLESAAKVGRTAGERTLNRLGSRQIKTGTYPVLFDATVAASLFGHAVNGVSGSSLYRGSSFLLDSLGKAIFSPLVNIDENPFVLKGNASGVFDSEGVATRQRPFVQNGVIEGYFLSTYSAKKLGLSSTGHAGGIHNMQVKGTGQTTAQLIRDMGTGFLVTELIGQGVNGITGDYSRGAAGFWVENGVIAYPIDEVTIAGNLLAMYQNISAIGNEALTRGAWTTGSVLISEMTVSGEE
ncbi:MAG: metalloprotease PmbA [Neisseriaceae bacterium]|nr:metalloprotease PmbA [Neisseriaceae bacterium]